MKRPVLVTGFEPFGTVRRNPSATLAERLDGERVGGRDVVGATLPVVFRESGQRLRELMAEHDPELVVSLGVAASRTVLSLERVAVNLDDARIPDNAGQQPIDTAIEPEGPAAYFTSLPIKAVMEKWERQGWRCEVSHSAGSYVCNHLFYQLMHALAERGHGRGGFVHIPRPRPGLRLRDMEAALRELIAVSLRRRRDARITAGRVD